MRVVRGARRSAAAVLGGYGRLLIGAAELIAPAVVRPVRTDSRPAPVEDAPIQASAADLATLRSAALDSTLAAAVDPGTSAEARFSARVQGVSDWTAGRLLADTERLRRAALEVSRAVTDPDGLVHRRRFALALRREFPWLTDQATYALWDHAVLMSHRHGAAPAATPEPAETAPRSRFWRLDRVVRGRVRPPTVAP